MGTYTPPTAEDMDAWLASVYNKRKETPVMDETTTTIDRFDLANALEAASRISTHLRKEMLDLVYDLRGPAGDRIEVVDDAYGLIVESLTKAKKDYLSANER